MGFITLTETGQQWSDWAAVAAMSTGTLTGGLGSKDLSALSSVTLVQTGDVLGSSTSISFTKGAGVPLKIVAAGFDRTAEVAAFKAYTPKYTSTRAAVDCNGGDTGIQLLNLSNVTIQGLKVFNGTTNSSSAGMIRGTGLTGTNVVEFCDIINGAIASRYTGSSGDIRWEYCNIIGHGYGALRFGAGQTGNVVDIGNVVVRNCNFRWNRGYMSVAQRIGQGVPLQSYDYTATDANQAIGFHGCLVLKNALSITVQNNILDGAGQFGLVLENTPTITIDSNLSFDAGIGTTTGGLMTVTPNSGAAPAMLIRRNLVMTLNGSFLATSGSGLLEIYENTIIELRKQIDSTAAVIIPGNIKNVVAMTTSGSLKMVNNLMIGNPANNSAFVSFPATGVNSAVLDYNSYDRGGNPSRGLLSGSVNGVAVGTTSQTTMQAQDQSAYSSAMPLREAHGKFTGGSLTAVTNTEIPRGLYRRLPAPSAGGSIIYPVFNPYPCVYSILSLDGATITNLPTGTVAANTTSNITVTGTAGQVPAIVLNALL